MFGPTTTAALGERGFDRVVTWYAHAEACGTFDRHGRRVFVGPPAAERWGIT
jgi:hypothetical protein